MARTAGSFLVPEIVSDVEVRGSNSPGSDPAGLGLLPKQRTAAADDAPTVDWVPIDLSVFRCWEVAVNGGFFSAGAAQRDAIVRARCAGGRHRACEVMTALCVRPGREHPVRRGREFDLIVWIYRDSLSIQAIVAHVILHPGWDRHDRHCRSTEKQCQANEMQAGQAARAACTRGRTRVSDFQRGLAKMVVTFVRYSNYLFWNSFQSCM
jgi:hypothetical protein